MSALTIDDKAALSDALENVKRVSNDLYETCKYVGTTMRGSFLALATAIGDNDIPKITDIVGTIRESVVVIGLSSKLHHLRERASEIWDELAPWGKVIFGLTIGIAGFFLSAQLGLLLSAILMIGGFLYAVTSALAIMYRKGLE